MGESPINTLQDDNETEGFFDPEAAENMQAFLGLEMDVIRKSINPNEFTTENKTAWIEAHAADLKFVIRENSHLLRDYAVGIREKDVAKKEAAVAEIMKLLG